MKNQPTPKQSEKDNNNSPDFINPEVDFNKNWK